MEKNTSTFSNRNKLMAEINKFERNLQIQKLFLTIIISICLQQLIPGFHVYRHSSHSKTVGIMININF